MYFFPYRPQESRWIFPTIDSFQSKHINILFLSFFLSFSLSYLKLKVCTDVKDHVESGPGQPSTVQHFEFWGGHILLMVVMTTILNFW